MTAFKDLTSSFGPLGLTAFGGPTAHLGYFREVFVKRRGWISEENYADTVALAQFLPGPASSQVGQAIGYFRGGWLGLIYSWFLFTAPSAILLTIAGLALSQSNIDVSGTGWIAGLLACAVGVVAHAVLGMARKLLTSPLTWVIAIVTLAVLVLFSAAFLHIAIIVAAAIIGIIFLSPRTAGNTTTPDDKGKSAGTTPEASFVTRTVSGRAAIISLAVFMLGLVGLWAGAALIGGWFFTRANAFFQAGALVFGGGHVVLPLLEGHFVHSGWLEQSEFIAGYSLAQAVPGPLFTFASYVGAVDAGIGGAVFGTIMIFLPGALLMIAGLHFWQKWQNSPTLRGAFTAVNAAVVGILAAALWDPIITHGVNGIGSLVLAATSFAALSWGKIPPWVIAAFAIIYGAVFL